MANLFQGPIPGQSLTDTPKNGPWENPPDLNTVEEATDYYIKKLSTPKALDDLSLVFQLGGNLRNVSETLALMGTMKGVHSVDVQMLVAPVIGEYIRLAMNAYGVEVPDDLLTEEEENAKYEESRMDAILQDAVERSIKEGGKGSEQLEDMQDAAESQEMEDEAPEMEEPEEAGQEVEPAAEEPVGLMARG